MENVLMSLKLHLGCWHRFIPGFIHVDYCDMPHIDYCSNIDKLPFFKDGLADLIYCSHAFEYFDRMKAKEVLHEWFRILKPGGVLRLAVPDFDALIKVYMETRQLDLILGPLYGRMSIMTTDGVKNLYHKTVYNEESLTSLLVLAGYVDVHRWNWRDTEHSEIDDHSQAYFPHMQKETGTLVSLNIEAIKP